MSVGSYNDYDDAIKDASQLPEEGYKNPQDETIIYVVEVVAKCYGDLKMIKDDCGPESIQK